ncbi:MAG: ATP-binding cassette domain-containing protein [Pseudonocardiaceae bacterium]|nr:ATP-binding cassette domain-containing protein [Pseudonocardiaceae bacterium]
MNAPVLELREVSRTFARSQALRHRGGGDIPAVAQVSLRLAAGETLALVGESGAGKSTVGRLVLGLESPDAGQVIFQGVDLADLHGRARRRIRRRMHLILQDPYESLHPGMQVGEAVGEPLAIAGVRRDERRERVGDALEDVELSPASRFLERFPHQLSGGQRQRVAIARSFIAHPELVVADEPTSMLDASLRSEILALMAGIRERLGTTFVLITHDLTAARAFAERVAVMQRGRVVEDGPIDRVLSAPADEYTKVLLAASEGRLPEEQT